MGFVVSLKIDCQLIWGKLSARDFHCSRFRPNDFC